MATYTGQVVGGGLNLRQSATTSSTSLILIPNGTQLSVTDYNTDWYSTSYGGYSGYVMKLYVQVSGSSGMTGTVVGGTLNLRASASTSDVVVTRIPNGTQLTVTNYNTDWYTTSYNDYFGYVMKQFVQLTSGGGQPGTVIGGGLNLRTSASTSSTVLIQIPNGTNITVLVYDPTWYKTSYGGYNGYVMQQYVQVSPSGSGSDSSVQGVVATGNSSPVNVRAQASTSSTLLGTWANGTVISVWDYNTDWYQVVWGTNTTAYVMKQFIDISGGTGGTTGSERYGRVTASPDLNVRKTASTSGTIAGSWPLNRIGIVTSYDSSWYKTNWKGNTAYVSKDYITDIGAASTSIVDRMLKIADNEVGVEEPGAYKYYGTSTAWCQVFVNWLATQAGMPSNKVPGSATTTYGVEFHVKDGNRFWFKGQDHKTRLRNLFPSTIGTITTANMTTEETNYVPRPGDFIYYRTSSTDNVSHVGFVYSVNTSAQTITTVEGNLSAGTNLPDRVKKLTGISYAGNTKIVGFGRLNY